MADLVDRDFKRRSKNERKMWETWKRYVNKMEISVKSSKT